MNNRKEPKGFGGWMILPTIGVAISPFLFLYSLIEYYNLYFENKEMLENLMDNSFLFTVYFFGNALLLIGLLVFSSTLFVLFFKKKKIVPQLIIWQYSFGITLSLIDIFIWSSLRDVVPNAGELVKQSGLDLVQSSVYAIIWIPYFMVSKRVKNTFIH